MQAWWFELPRRADLAALVADPGRIVAAMQASSWRINQDVDHMCSSLRLAEGGVAFAARDVAALARALAGAGMDVRLFSAEGDALAMRFAPFAVPQRGDALAAGTLLLVARRAAFGAVACPLGLSEHRTSVRRLGGLVGALAR